MPATLTEEEFSKHVNTKFRVESDPPVELELREVKSYLGQTREQSGMERFSLFFAGPGDRYLAQKIYAIEHEQMGTFELFLVPVGGDANGFRYEAVFHYFRDESKQ